MLSVTEQLFAYDWESESLAWISSHMNVKEEKKWKEPFTYFIVCSEKQAPS